jgi:hypothetical protein
MATFINVTAGGDDLVARAKAQQQAGRLAKAEQTRRQSIANEKVKQGTSEPQGKSLEPLPYRRDIAAHRFPQIGYTSLLICADDIVSRLDEPSPTFNELYPGDRPGYYEANSYKILTGARLLFAFTGARTATYQLPIGNTVSDQTSIVRDPANDYESETSDRFYAALRNTITGASDPYRNFPLPPSGYQWSTLDYNDYKTRGIISSAPGLLFYVFDLGGTLRPQGSIYESTFKTYKEYLNARRISSNRVMSLRANLRSGEVQVKESVYSPTTQTIRSTFDDVLFDDDPALLYRKAGYLYEFHVKGGLAHFFRNRYTVSSKTYTEYYPFFSNRETGLPFWWATQYLDAFPVDLNLPVNEVVTYLKNCHFDTTDTVSRRRSVSSSLGAASRVLERSKALGGGVPLTGPAWFPNTQPCFIQP